MTSLTGKNKISPNRVDCRRNAAFTLVELLVVVGIMLLLMALLLPSLDTAHDKAVQSSCLNNQRQLSIGFNLYCTDNKGAFACWDPYQSPGQPTSWFKWDRQNQQPPNPNYDYSQDVKKYLEPYCGLKAWLDPGAPPAAQPFSYGIGPVLSRHYSGSSVYGLTVTSRQGFGPVALAEIPSPATAALLACKTAYSSASQNLYFAGGGGYCAMTITLDNGTHGPWALHGPWFKPGIRSRTNVMRLDGSARTYETKELLRSGNVYGVPYQAPYYLSAQRHYLWSGWNPNTTANAELVGVLKE